MTLRRRLLLLVAGYLAAGLVAWLAVEVNAALSPGVDRSGGMSAFGDLLLFLAVFVAGCIAATVGAFAWKRPGR